MDILSRSTVPHDCNSLVSFNSGSSERNISEFRQTERVVPMQNYIAVDEGFSRVVWRQSNVQAL